MVSIGGIAPGTPNFVGTPAGPVNLSGSFLTIFSPTDAGSNAPTGAIIGKYSISRTTLKITRLLRALIRVLISSTTSLHQV
ncbi:hypothetical protein LWM68_31695 [Niabella sp. W65]|nr:hypothetical protein [Niabella sp. W65]MCH7366929.1 hypothetical protein [Niabella sp. W65]